MKEDPTISKDTRQRTLPPHLDYDWPEDGSESLGACPVCESAHRTVLHDDLRDNIYFCAPGQWTMWRCEHCRSAYLDPRPTPETIHLAYTKYYTHESPLRPETDGRSSLPRKVRRSLANGYRNWRYGTERRPASPLGVVVALAFPPVRRPIDIGLRYLPHPKTTKGRRVLDIGSGSGAFLDSAASAGWRAFGCDPDPVAVENSRARGLNVRKGGIEAWADEEGSFDAVTLSHVIEHLHHPVEVLRSVHRLLRPGGHLYLDTPNIDALGHSAYGPFWRGLDPPRHLVLLGWSNCVRTLANIGFEGIARRRRPGIMADYSVKSIRAAAGLDPSSEEDSSISGAGIILRTRSQFARNRSEFLTLTCRKRR